MVAWQCVCGQGHPVSLLVRKGSKPWNPEACHTSVPGCYNHGSKSFRNNTHKKKVVLAMCCLVVDAVLPMDFGTVHNTARCRAYHYRKTKRLCTGQQSVLIFYFAYLQ